MTISTPLELEPSPSSNPLPKDNNSFKNQQGHKFMKFYEKHVSGDENQEEDWNKNGNLAYLHIPLPPS